MNLYLLRRPFEDVRRRYDVCDGFVVAASGEDAARAWAAEVAAREGGDVWMNPQASTCALLGRAAPGIKPGIVLGSFRAG